MFAIIKNGMRLPKIQLLVGLLAGEHKQGWTGSPNFGGIFFPRSPKKNEIADRKKKKKVIK
jgi:hypothetical protein